MPGSPQTPIERMSLRFQINGYIYLGATTLAGARAPTWEIGPSKLVLARSPRLLGGGPEPGNSG